LRDGLIGGGYNKLSKSWTRPFARGYGSARASLHSKPAEKEKR